MMLAIAKGIEKQDSFKQGNNYYNIDKMRFL